MFYAAMLHQEGFRHFTEVGMLPVYLLQLFGQFSLRFHNPGPITR